MAADIEPSKLAVMDRKQPEYAARGIRAGTFLVYPTLTTSILYDSNVFATPDGQSDGVFVVRPELAVRSDWTRHKLDMYANLDARKFFRFEDEDKVSGSVGFDGRVDVRSDIAIDTRASFAHITEERGTGDSFDPNDDLLEYDNLRAGVTVRKGFNRLYTALSYDYLNQDYKDTNFDQDFRDNDKHVLRGRVGYRISPLTSVFVEPSVNWRDYRDETLDSDGWRAVAGLAFEPTRLMKGEVFAGYLSQDYDSYDDIETVTFGGHLEWYVTPLMTISFDANRETDSTFGSSRLESYFSARADYELRRNVILSGLVGYENAEYEDVDRNDDTVTAAAIVKYLVNPWLSVGAEYRYKTFESDVVSDYDRHRVGLTATAQY
jgi:hypothetical protein